MTWHVTLHFKDGKTKTVSYMTELAAIYHGEWALKNLPACKEFTVNEFPDWNHNER